MTLPLRSTPGPSPRSRTDCERRWRAAPRSSSPTASPPSRLPTRSWSSTAAASWIAGLMTSCWSAAPSTRRSPRRDSRTRSTCNAISRTVRSWPSCERVERCRELSRSLPLALAADPRRRWPLAEGALAVLTAPALPAPGPDDVRRPDPRHGGDAGAAVPGRPGGPRLPERGLDGARADHRRVPRDRPDRLGHQLSADLPGRLGRGAGAPGPADPDLHPSPGDVDRVLYPEPAGRSDLEDHKRRRCARSADQQRRGHPLLQHPDAGRGRGDHAHRGRPARARGVPDTAPAGDRQPGLPDRGGQRIPDHPRAHRRGDRVPPGDAERRPGRSELRPGAPPRRADGGAQRAQPQGEPEDGLPERLVLPGRRAALSDRHGRDPALRRLPGARSGDGVGEERSDRCRRRVRRLPLHLLRPDPATLQPLHDLPAGDGRPPQKKFHHPPPPPPPHPHHPDTEPDMVDKPGALDPGTLRGEIEMDGVWFSYGLDRTAGRKRSSGKIETAGEEEDDAAWALEDVSIRVPAGQTLALVGETGAGKSTFAKLVSRFYDPQKGRVLVDGNDLRDLS